MKNIPLYRVHLPPVEELMPELQKVLYSGMITEGVKVKEFEEKFQKKFDLAYRPLSVNSGTSALQLAYRLCHVKNRIVLTTPMTCFANVCSILNEGGKIVWCDIDPNTGNISADDVKKKIELYDARRIACVSFVDLAGFPADLDKLDEVCDWIPLVEDAAQSLGARWNKRWIGQGFRNFGEEPGDHYACYSFQAIKHLTTVDGGMMIANGAWQEFNSLARGKKLKWFGIDREAAKEETRWNYDIEEHGGKWHMNNVNATIGLAQLNNLDIILDAHKLNGQYYNEALKNVSGVQLMTIPEKSEPSYWIYPLRVQKREEFAKMMKANGIAVNIAHVRNDSYSVVKNSDYVLNHWETLHAMDAYEKEYIFIPCHWGVSGDDCQYIVDTIKKGW